MKLLLCTLVLLALNDVLPVSLCRSILFLNFEQLNSDCMTEFAKQVLPIFLSPVAACTKENILR